ncbi:MAG TPA: MSMEG_6728 family protein [Marisediminicola sp.]|nr:MSMEG_6728 family protein [Marisediminicola sp.]
MQTFLPYADFVESARSLDQARLGKQRVEALQVLRAIVLPAYGWQSHPAMQMWRGYVPALTRYALDTVDTWTSLGRADTTRPLIAEFAPEVDGTTIASLPRPTWLGNEELHLSHRSNLVRKDPEFYRPLFPGVPGDLPYLWPGPDADAPLSSAPSGPPLWIIRAGSAGELEAWAGTGSVMLAETSPRGRRTPAWQRQLDRFAELRVGTAIAALVGNGAVLLGGTIEGRVTSYRGEEDETGLKREVGFDREMARAEFPYPALLQDPRSVFEVPGPGW